MAFKDALERVTDMQKAQQRDYGRIFKYIIFSQVSPGGGRVWVYRRSPCPGCNPLNPSAVNFFRENFGTVWYCKKHQKRESL